MNPRPRSGRIGFDHDQPAIDLLPPVHPRGVLLADETALAEADAVQLRRIALEPQDIAELGPAFAHAEAEAVLKPAGRRFVGRGEPAVAEQCQARVDTSSILDRPVHRDAFIALDPN